MVNSRAKGRRAELDFARMWGGRRVSRTGQTGADVRTPPLILDLDQLDEGGLTVWEVKRRSTLAGLMAWYRQALDAGAHGVALRADRGPWLVLLPAAILTPTPSTSCQCQGPG